MRLTIVAVGRLKRGPERELAARYESRAAASGRGLGLRAIEVVEVEESRSREPERRMLEESIAIATLVPEDARLVLLDPGGESLSSTEFASLLGSWRDSGVADCCFVIGGPDGLAPTLRERAARELAFGKMTWPHQLVRVMLLEQVYRAITILSGHPYHRQ